MSGERDDLILDLRSHAHEVPDHIGRIMRDAARALETSAEGFDLVARSCPIPPPDLGGKHRRPRGAMVGADGAPHGSGASCR